MTTIRIATRGSDLALWQARYVAGRIETELGAATELVVVKTTGDRIQNVSLAKIGGKGLFVKEIEEALLDGRADVAVHSAKDLPALMADGLELVAFPQRADSRDALVGRQRGASVAKLAAGARVGTGSARRAAQLSSTRPDLEIVALRGNVPTRLQKLESENLAAVVLACAGLDRLGLGARIDERISPDTMLPAVAQGALALEARSNDPVAIEIAKLDDVDTAICVNAERGFLLRLGGDCTVPLACFAELSDTRILRVRALLASADGSKVLREQLEIDASPGRPGVVKSAANAGTRLAESVLAAGGAELLEQLQQGRSEAEA